MRDSTRSRARAIWLLSGEIIGLVAQLWLIYFGFTSFVLDDTDDEVQESLNLLAWCLIGTFYLFGTAMWLHLTVKFTTEDHPILKRFVAWPVVRWISLAITFSSSLVGLLAAVTLIVVREDPDHLAMYELAAVWTMLVSWALFHWGYSRIYYAKYMTARGQAPLVFPGTETPRMADFVYFSYQNGTSFAASDVMITTTPMRWTFAWHSVFSFFFNALIIVLSMNTIAGGLQGGGLDLTG